MRRLLSTKMQRNKIAKRMKKQANLDDVLRFADDSVKDRIEELYNSDEQMAEVFQILADGGYHFDKNFEQDIANKLLSWDNDVDNFLSKTCNVYGDSNAPQELKDFIENFLTNTSDGNFKDQVKNLPLKDLREGLSNYIQQGNLDFLKDDTVKETLLKWFDENIKDKGNFEYVFNYLLQDDGFKNSVIKNGDNLETILDTIPEENLISFVKDKGKAISLILKDSNFMEELSKNFRTYQTPDGIVIMEK